MGDLPPLPPGSQILVDDSGELLRITLPGRWSLVLWASLLGVLVFIAMSAGMLYSGVEPPGSGRTFLQIMPYWGILCGVWFFFVLKARRETVTIGREAVETRGAFMPLVSKSMKLAQIRRFVLKPVEAIHLPYGP